MKSLANVYKGFGRTMQASMNRTGGNLFEGVHPPIWQTPGKLQYYKAEMEPFIPDEIKWQIRAPTRFAMSSPKMTYLERVKTEVRNFMNESIKYDYLRPDRDLSLDFTVREAEILISASPVVRKLGESGELKQIHKKFSSIQEKVEADYLTLRDEIAVIVQQAEDIENQIYENLEELGLSGLQRSTSIRDILGGGFNQTSQRNLATISKWVNEQAEGHVHQASLQKLQGVIGVKAKAWEIKCTLHQDYCAKVALNDISVKDELAQLRRERDLYREAFSQAGGEAKDQDSQAMMETLETIRNQKVPTLTKTFTEYEQCSTDRERVYHHFMRDEQNEALDNFRQDVLQHLAGSIVVKEHRQRYQKEQYDRFMRSLMLRNLKNVNMTLNEFCVEYAIMIENNIIDSHNGSSPNIEANYDDFAEKTVRPLNATIFYYFFSGDRRRKTIAQWLLSTVRYPNEKIRRAYMRFFA